MAAPSAADGRVGRGCHYPTPAASSARDRQSPRAAKQNGEVSRVGACGFLAAALLLAAGLAGAEPLSLYVATNGSDAWSGRLAAPAADQKDGPFATLERARDEIRRLKQGAGLPAGGVTVALRGGTTFRGEVLAFGEADSGTAAAPIVYTAYGNEEVTLSAAKAIGGFVPVTDPAVLARLPAEARGHVLQTSLPQQGITDFGAIGLQTHQAPLAALELLLDGKPMTLARWPNTGFAKIAGAPKGEKGDTFAYADDRPARWVDEPDARGNGYWDFDWAASNVAFAGIDTAKRTITTKPPHAVYGYRKGGRFYAYNLLSELDQPGEWYLDRRNGLLYFWPPSDLTKAAVEVSVGPGFLALNQVSHVTFRRLILQGCRGEAVSIRDGARVQLVGCTLRSLGTRAISISGGTDHRIAGCDLYDINEGAIAISGGERKTLVPARHVIENCLFTRIGRWQRTYVPAVDLSGVGCRVANNLMYDIAHSVLLFRGNDHIIEYNEVHSMGFEGGEMGAFYCGRNWTLSGNIVRYNYLHDIYNPCPQRNRAFMLDDGAAGITMTGNLIVRVAEGISLSSINNVIDNNVFVDCYPAIGCWGGAASFPPFDPQTGHNPTMWPPLAELALDQPPWSVRFPEMLPLREAIRTGGPVPPQCRAQITRNVVWQGDAEWTGFHMTKDKAAWVIADNLVGTDPRFVDAAKGDYRLQPDSPAPKLGFKPIPVAKIGLYQSPERASWPVRHEVRQDVCRDFVYVPPPAPPRPAVPPLRIPPVAAVPALDGALGEGEWSGPGVALEQDPAGDVIFSPSRAWLTWDAQALYVAFSNPVNGTNPMALGTAWGTSEAVEIALRRTDAKGAPILVLRGYAKGSFESSTEAGTDAETARRAATGVTFAAKAINASLWTCEWRLPFAAIGVDPKTQRSLSANLTVRKVADNLWVLWAATGGRSWELDRAGRIELAPP
jgi:hypothetical protein